MGKGVVTAILPDDQMPETEDGDKAEVVLSPFGVIARTNPAQLVELHINFYSEQILNKMIDIYNDSDDSSEILESLQTIYFDYLEIVSPEQYDFTIDTYNELEDEERMDFFTNILQESNLYIHQPPFFGNISLDEMEVLMDKFPDIKPFKMKKIKNDLVMGYMYFIRLKHYALSKFSARSAGMLNLKDVPSKSMNFKNDISQFSKTPIRFGKKLPDILVIIY